MPPRTEAGFAAQFMAKLNEVQPVEDNEQHDQEEPYEKKELPESSTQEKLSPEDVEALMSILAQIPNSQRDSARQRAVIENLPYDLFLDLRGHMHTAYINAEKYGNTLSTDKEGYVLRGEVFENLVKYDISLLPKKPEEMEPETMEQMNQLLALIQDPERFGLEDRLITDDGRSLRNPDAAYIHINNKGQLVIQGVGEVKFGLLNKRAIQQLKMVPESMRKLQEILNTYNDPIELRRVGLDKLANRLEQLRESVGDVEMDFVTTADNFNQVLIVPQNRSSNRMELLKRGVEKDHRAMKKYNEAMNHVDVKQAAFTTQEVAALSEYIAGRIEG